MRAVEQSMAMSTMPSIAPLFLEDAVFHSTLSIVNEADAPTIGRVLLLDQGGVELTEQAIPLKGHSSARIQLSHLLPQTGAPVYGNVELYDNNAGVNGTTLVGQVTISYGDSPRIYNIDEELGMPSATVSHELRALAISATAPPYLAIVNPMNTQESISVTCYDEAQPIARVTLFLGPSQTSYLRGCAQLPDIGAGLRQSLSLQSAHAARSFAYDISSLTVGGEVQAFALSPYAQAGSLDWTAVDFFDPDTMLSPTTVFAGIPIGSAPELWGTYTLRLALHNFSRVTQTVTLRADTMIGGSAVKTPLEQVVVAPDQSTSISLAGATGDKTLLNTLVVTGSDENGGIAAQLLLEDPSQNLRFQIIGKSQADDRNIGMHPWQAAAGTDNVLLLYNETASLQRATLRIGNGQALWQKEYLLAPYETKRFSLAAMFLQKPKDDSGMQLSQGEGVGSISWAVPIGG